MENARTWPFQLLSPLPVYDDRDFFFNFCFQVLSSSLQFIETAAKSGVS